MNSKPMKPNGLFQTQKIDFNHYAKLLYEKKLWIFISIFAVTLVWLFIYPFFASKENVFEFSSVIRFDEPRAMSGASGVDAQFTQMEVESKISVMKTTSFLTKVVDSLSLNIQSSTPGVSRNQLFSHIHLSENPGFGRYKLKNVKNEIQVFYTNKNEGFENTLIQNAIINLDSTYQMNINGLHLVGLSSIFKKYEEVEFSCIPARYVIGHLRQNVIYRVSTRQTILTIFYENKDPFLGAQILNTITDLFLKESLEFKKIRTTTALASLEEQLNSSKIELEKVENELKRFRELNPQVFITENIAGINRELVQSEAELNTIERNIEQINRLMQERTAAESEQEVNLIFQEIANFLLQQNVTGITAAIGQFNSELQRRDQLITEGYSETNPNLQQVNNSLQSLRDKIRERAIWFIKDQYERQSRLSDEINLTERRFRQSPSKELVLARLLRDREAKSRVYSNILLRYNEVKVAHASITPDAYLLEKAEVPLMEYNFMERIIKYLILLMGPILGLFLGVGIIIGTDFLWHHARSEQDISHLVGIPVLASIPVINNEKNELKEFEPGKKMDDKLVTIDYAPSLEADSFRNLRTKLILNTEKNQKQRFILTSYLPGDGKSLITANLAITFAQLKLPTLIIDGDMRRGVLHNTFVCNKRPGLSDFLSRSKTVNYGDIAKIIQKTSIPYLSLISSGTNIPNPTELLIDDKMRQFLEKLSENFQYIFIDTAPIEFIPDAFVLNNLVNNLLIVMKYGKTDVKKIRKLLEDNTTQLNGVRGIILNGAKDILHKKYYGYSYYKY